jgi:hypothetical protein
VNYRHSSSDDTGGLPHAGESLRHGIREETGVEDLGEKVKQGPGDDG